ncbi:hypothetical protein [Brevundimonas sp. SGAir0440]|nr:hypothetical protein [Brevundimonas sp. SGAir0440]
MAAGEPDLTLEEIDAITGLKIRGAERTLQEYPSRYPQVAENAAQAAW